VPKKATKSPSTPNSSHTASPLPKEISPKESPPKAKKVVAAKPKAKPVKEPVKEKSAPPTPEPKAPASEITKTGSRSKKEAAVKASPTSLQAGSFVHTVVKPNRGHITFEAAEPAVEPEEPTPTAQTEQNGEVNVTPKRRRQRSRRKKDVDITPSADKSFEMATENDELVNYSEVIRAEPTFRVYTEFPLLEGDPIVDDLLYFHQLALLGGQPQVVQREGRVTSVDGQGNVTIVLDPRFVNDIEISEEQSKDRFEIEVVRGQLSDIRVIERK